MGGTSKHCGGAGNEIARSRGGCTKRPFCFVGCANTVAEMEHRIGILYAHLHYYAHLFTCQVIEIGTEYTCILCSGHLLSHVCLLSHQIDCTIQPPLMLVPTKEPNSILYYILKFPLHHPFLDAQALGLNEKKSDSCDSQKVSR